MPDHLNKRIRNIEERLHKIELEFGAPRQQNKAGISKQEASQDKPSPAEGQPGAVPEVPPLTSDENKSKQSWYKTLEGWKVLLEIIAIPFAIVYAVVTALQWCDLRHHFQADQRAWIAVNHGQIRLADNQPISVPVAYTNSGKTPAFFVDIKIAVRVFRRDEVPELTFDLKRLSYFTGALATLTPGNPQEIDLASFGELSAAKRSEINLGQSLALVFGKITYRDVFKSSHWIQFCLQPSIRQSLGSHVASDACAAYNQTDDAQ